MLMAAPRKADRIFLVYLAVLVIFGLAALMSASSPAGYTQYHDAYYFLKRQIFFGLIPGIVFFLAFAKLDYHVWKKIAWVVYGLSIGLLLLIFIPHFGRVINGAHSWLALGPISFEPAEIAKLSVVIIASFLLTREQRDWTNWQTSLLPILALLAPIFLLIVMEPDVGTLSILVMIVFMLLYIGAVPKRYLLVLGLIGVVGFFGLIIAAPYRTERLTIFLHPELDPQGIGYQMNQAFLAVGSGGFWGLGFGHSRQKFQYLPEASADTIFAIIAEENGFIVSIGLIVLILLITWRGLKIAKGAPDEFGCLLVSGIMVWFVWQSLLNIGATVGALPLTGVPLPFISHGGSALAAALGAMGIVANVSKQSEIA